MNGDPYKPTRDGKTYEGAQEGTLNSPAPPGHPPPPPPPPTQHRTPLRLSDKVMAVVLGVRAELAGKVKA